MLLKRTLLWVVISILLLWHLATLRSAVDRGAIPLYDFIEYWSAGRLFTSGGNPYSESQLLAAQRAIGWGEERPIMMWNPPWTLLLVAPFSFLPYWTGRGLWLLFQVSLVLCAADWLWRWYGGSHSHRWISWIAALIFIPNVTAFYLGQISPILLLGLVGFLWSLGRQKFASAGAFTLLISVKPHVPYLFWACLLLWIWEERKWRVIGGGALALGGSLVLTVLINPGILVHYKDALLEGSGPLIWQTPTWGVAALMAFPTAGEWLRFLPTVVGLVLGLWLWRRRKQRFSWRIFLAPILLLSVISSSFTWMFDWVLLLPITIEILTWFQADPKRCWWLLPGILLIEAGLIVQPSFARSNFYTIWMPPSLAALYAAGKRLGIATRHAEGSQALPAS